MKEKLKKSLRRNEKILYEGVPKKSCYIFESIFNTYLKELIVWIVFSAIIFLVLYFLTTLTFYESLFIAIISLIIRIKTFINFIRKAVYDIKNYKNIYYIVTNKNVYVSENEKEISIKAFMQLTGAELHMGFINKLFKTADIIITQDNNLKRSDPLVFYSISNYNEVYDLICKREQYIYDKVISPML